MSWPSCISQLQRFVANTDWFIAVLWRNMNGRWGNLSFMTALEKQLPADQG